MIYITGDTHGDWMSRLNVHAFVPTSIGTIGTVKCSCGAEFTFQDLV